MNESLRGLARFVREMHPVRLVALGYLSYAVIGWLLLALPIAHVAGRVSSLDALFTATSALSTTGLGTVSTGNDFNWLGQLLILALIQIGGIGYMTFGSFVVLSRSGTLSQRRRSVGSAVFSLPAEFRIDKFLRSVIVFTVVMETLGVLVLFYYFSALELPRPLWTAVFHSVSAFCTAGFSLYDDSFMAMRDHAGVNVTIGILSYLGAIGFIVFVDVWRRIIGKVPSLTLTTRIILVTTTWVSVAGVALFYVAEPSIQDLPNANRLLAAIFQVMAAITTVGFNTVPIGALSQASLFLVIMLMVIGASPSGTGGGLKTTTFTAAFGAIRSALSGRTGTTFWGRAVPEERVRVAMASLCFYAVFLILGCYLLALTESFPFEDLLFEAASALGTVGLSTGITASLSPLGKLIVTGLMFVGRLGPLSFGMALFLPVGKPESRDRDDLVV
ncbi:MAG TPA: potassium transporter TrkG [Candidatus Krumholzibacteria bacterium]|nr:potassium transporter TrkG [Candidatus Krumholzibacteria bacterium]HPD72948.1 potassium transporter TrkG [Candidatus Krumholzibacteria bacterium]HRY41747.1 potassium transporter TrkG [Candidatus Krumholzibacteria bacterium]